MVVIIGGTGLLGSELSKYFQDDCISIGSNYDIYSFDKLETLLDEVKPKTIINCAAIKSEKVDENPLESININIIGSSNLSKYCIKKDIRLVYISTDYVYPGTHGSYKEEDPLYPNNNYAWTKLAGECSTKLVGNHVIIRTSFGSSKFPYKKAFDNLFTSKDYVDVISPLIYKVVNSNFIGTINIGTEKKSIYDYAIIRNPDKEKESRKITQDFSLDLNKLESILKIK